MQGDVEDGHCAQVNAVPPDDEIEH